MAKSLSLNDYEAEVVPSSELVMMEIKRLAKEQGKPMTIQEVKDKGRAIRIVERVGLFVMGSFAVLLLVHILVAWVKR
jgi:hypothetical protein